MTPEIIDSPFRVVLVGHRGRVEGASYGPTGKQLMDRLWSEVRQRGIKTKGVNHWVYLPGSEMFTGVELLDPAAEVGPLERLMVVLPRYARRLHVGPYSGLADAWCEMKAALAAAGETPAATGLEVYGHWNEDPAKLETTILIGLGERPG